MAFWIGTRALWKEALLGDYCPGQVKEGWSTLNAPQQTPVAPVRGHQGSSEHKLRRKPGTLDFTCSLSSSKPRKVCERGSPTLQGTLEPTKVAWQGMPTAQKQLWKGRPPEGWALRRNTMNHSILAWLQCTSALSEPWQDMITLMPKTWKRNLREKITSNRFRYLSQKSIPLSNYKGIEYCMYAS